MKTTIDINQQLQQLQAAIIALNAMQSTVQSIMIVGDKPLIRIAKNGHCLRLYEQGKACYFEVGHNGSGRFRQGAFELHGCRVIWSESLH